MHCINKSCDFSNTYCDTSSQLTKLVDTNVAPTGCKTLQSRTLDGLAKTCLMYQVWWSQSASQSVERNEDKLRTENIFLWQAKLCEWTFHCCNLVPGMSCWWTWKNDLMLQYHYLTLEMLELRSSLWQELRFLVWGRTELKIKFQQLFCSLGAHRYVRVGWRKFSPTYWPFLVTQWP
jgi:hypothetical protein